MKIAKFHMARWVQVKGSNGAEYRYTPNYNTGYSYVNAAFYNNKGVFSIIYNHRGDEEMDTWPIRKAVSDYFSQYGKRIVVVDKGKRGTYYLNVQVYFLQDERPSVDQVNYWFSVIKNKVHQY